MAWFRGSDELGERADQLASTAAERVGQAWDDGLGLSAGLAGKDREAWRRAATVAAVLLAVFPLLRACRGEVARFERLKVRMLAGLEERFPKCAALVREAEGATVPPSGYERNRTLTEVDEATSLALAGWVVRHLGAGSDRSWDDLRRIAPVLRRAVDRCWVC